MKVIFRFLATTADFTGINSAEKVSDIFSSKRGKGTPSVFFVSGLGEDYSTWSKFQDSIAYFTSTISYDRAGLGKSRPIIYFFFLRGFFAGACFVAGATGALFNISLSTFFISSNIACRSSASEVRSGEKL